MDIMEIKFFLASSIEEFEFDRLVIGDYFNQLNNIFHGRGIYCSLIKCEHYEKSTFNKDGKQNELDNDIRNSDIVFFLFYKKVGDYTKHEFEIALDAYKKQNKPKIVTYFKHVEDVDEISGDVRAFMDNLGNKLQHYYRTYNHPDTLKVEAVTQILQLVSKDLNLTISGGSIMLDDQKIADMENVPILNGNAALKELIDKKDELLKRQKECRSDLLSDSDNEEKWTALSQVSKELDEVSKRLAEVENATFELMRTIATMTAGGENGSERMRKAISAYDRGDYDAAIAILEDKERQNELKRARLLKEAGKRLIIWNISESQMLIDSWVAQGQVKERWEDIKSEYDMIFDLVEEENLSCDYLRKYVNFFLAHHDPVRPAKAAGQLSEYCSNPKIEDSKKAEINNLLGAVYMDQFITAVGNKEDEKANELFRRADEAIGNAIAIYENLAKNDPRLYEHELANSYSAHSVLCIEKYDYEQEKELSKAISTNQHIKNQNIKRGDHNYAVVKSNPEIASDLFIKAKENVTKSKNIYERLAQRDPKKYEYWLANACHNYGSLVCRIEKYVDEAKKEIKRAIDINEKIAKNDPENGEFGIAYSYSTLGTMYAQSRDWNEAQAAFDESIKRYKLLVERDPIKYNRYLADNYHLIGMIRLSQNDKAQAAEEFNKAKCIYEKLAEQDPDTYGAKLSNILNSLNAIQQLPLETDAQDDEDSIMGALSKMRHIEDDMENHSDVELDTLGDVYQVCGNYCIEKKRYAEAEEIFEKMKTVYEILTKRAPDKYEGELGRVYTCIGDAYYESWKGDESYNKFKYDEARKAYIKAKNIYEGLAEIDLAKYEGVLAGSYCTLGSLYLDNGKYDKSKEEYEKGRAIFAKLAAKDPDKYKPLEARALIGKGYNYKKRGNINQSEELLRRALEIFEEYEQKEPGKYGEDIRCAKSLLGQK